MINAREFRIGNIIGDEEGSTFIIEELEIDFIKAGALSIYPAGIDDNYGIPLTEEWLLKFGFIAIDDDGGFEHPTEKCFQLYDRYLDKEGFSHVWDAAYTGAPCLYVHQLQNLYFALVGEELTIKE